MVAISNLFCGAKERWGKGLWLGAMLALALVGASLAEVTSNDGPTLSGSSQQAASNDALPGVVPATAAAPAPDGAGGEQNPSPTATAAAPGAEQQRRLFMLLLLNSAGPHRPYGSLSR